MLKYSILEFTLKSEKSVITLRKIRTIKFSTTINVQMPQKESERFICVAGLLNDITEACWDVFLLKYLKTNGNNNSLFEALVYLHVSTGREIFLCLFLSAVSSVAQSKFEISGCIQNFLIIFVPLNTFFCVF